MMQKFVVLVFLLIGLVSPALAQTSSTAAGRDSCIAKGRAKFIALVEDAARHLRDNRGFNKGNELKYIGAKRLTSLAICIDWERSTPEYRAGRGHGYSFGFRSQALADSNAISHCANAQDARNRICQCVVVHRNDVVQVSFPSGWPQECT
jgi:hypothetical protein